MYITAIVTTKIGQVKHPALFIATVKIFSGFLAITS